MALETWLTFLLASALLIIVPGPTVLMLIGYGLARGRRIALYTMPGVMLGAALSMTLAIAGLGAVLAASAALFTAMKLAGAAYLLWIGISMWRASFSGEAPAATQKLRSGDRAAFLHAFAVTALNPKLVAFHMAFLPQFIDPAAPLLPQAMILVLTFIGMQALLDTSYALAAGSARSFAQSPRAMRLTQRVGGSALIGAGVAVAALRRT